MPQYGNASITVADNGAANVIVPASSVQVVFGVSSIGTAAQPIATRSLATLTSSFGYGPLVEAAALAILNGGTIIACKLTSNTAGTQKAVQFTGAGSSVITATGNAFDTYYIFFKVIVGGTIGVAGIQFQISLDAGRHFGPIIPLGTANTYVIANTGVTLNFAAGTLVANDVAKFGTVEPLWNTAGVQTAVTAVKNSPFAVTGWGSMHLVGGSTAGGTPGADMATIEGYLDTAATTNFVYTRLFASARDASPPATYGGTGEAEATWTAALLTDYSATSAIRSTVGAAYWNMPSAYPSAVFGSPNYRRSATWAAAARQVAVPPQRHLGRVKDGALSTIVVDTVNDPLDGFVYHDERINPGLDYLAAGSGGRFMSTWTRIGLPGVYLTNPLTMAPFGSQFALMMFGNVMDVACSITHQVGQQQVNDDVRLNANGTLYENDASTIEKAITSALNVAMTATGMLSPKGAVAVVDRTANVGSTSIVPILVTLYGKGYVLQENITIAFNNPLAAST